jgi:hypothetical protein
MVRECSMKSREAIKNFANGERMSMMQVNRFYDSEKIAAKSIKRKLINAVSSSINKIKD